MRCRKGGDVFQKARGVLLETPRAFGYRIMVRDQTDREECREITAEEDSLAFLNEARARLYSLMK